MHRVGIGLVAALLALPAIGHAETRTNGIDRSPPHAGDLGTMDVGANAELGDSATNAATEGLETIVTYNHTSTDGTPVIGEQNDPTPEVVARAGRSKGSTDQTQPTLNPYLPTGLAVSDVRSTRLLPRDVGWCSAAR